MEQLSTTTTAATCLALPSLLHTWLQKMEESSEGLPPGLARRARSAVVKELREEERKSHAKAEELARVIASL